MKYNIQYSIFTLFILLSLTSCLNQECNPKEFKTGKFEFVQTINGKKQVTTFERTDKYQIETYNGKTDSATVRWLNDYEFILQNIHPKSMLDKKPISMKILSTKGKTYTFEYSFVGEQKKQQGIVTKID